MKRFSLLCAILMCLAPMALFLSACEDTNPKPIIKFDYSRPYLTAINEKIVNGSKSSYSVRARYANSKWSQPITLVRAATPEIALGNENEITWEGSAPCSVYVDGANICPTATFQSAQLHANAMGLTENETYQIHAVAYENGKLPSTPTLAIPFTAPADIRNGEYNVATGQGTAFDPNPIFSSFEIEFSGLQSGTITIGLFTHRFEYRYFADLARLDVGFEIGQYTFTIADQYFPSRRMVITSYDSAGHANVIGSGEIPGYFLQSGAWGDE